MTEQPMLSSIPTKEWAEKIRQMGLATPALLLLEAHKPLSFIAGQFILISQPVLNLFFSAAVIDKVVVLLSDRAYLEDLIVALERDR
jgi:hypothetical protein